MREKLRSRTSRVSAVTTVLNDHELLEQFIANFNGLFGNGTATIPKTTVTATLKFSQRLKGHFAYEEERLFPALRATMSSAAVARLIAELQAEHKELEKQADQLKKRLVAGRLTDQNIQSLRAAMRNLGEQLQRHSAKENELIPSLL